MRLYLVRHGETEWNRLKILQGQTDIPLNETGILQARTLAEKVAELPFQGIVYSPLLRTKQTADIIYEILKQKEALSGRNLWMRENALLMEQDYGCANGRSITFTDEEWDQWYSCYGQGGESDREFEKRMNRAALSLLMYEAESLLIISHGAVIGKLMEIFTGQPVLISGIKNGTIYCVEVETKNQNEIVF